MKLEGVKPLSQFLIIEAPTAKENTTASGLIISENEHDYLMSSQVIQGTKLYPSGTHVIYHVIDMDSAFRDGNKGYVLIHESKIRGTYDPKA